MEVGQRSLAGLSAAAQGQGSPADADEIMLQAVLAAEEFAGDSQRVEADSTSTEEYHAGHVAVMADEGGVVWQQAGLVASRHSEPGLPSLPLPGSEELLSVQVAEVEGAGVARLTQLETSEASLEETEPGPRPPAARE